MLLGSPERQQQGGEVEVEAVEQRYKAPGLLIFGASSSLLASLLIMVVGTIEFVVNKRNHALRLDYPSGNGYWPSTVSLLVHNHESPVGKLFYTFSLIAGICIFQSQYPFHLRNVYTGCEKVGGTRVYWTTFRQIFPSMGLWLLVGVNTYPMQIALHSAGYTKVFCIVLHLLGGGMVFVGYMICELKCLHLIRDTSHSHLHIKPAELRIRSVLAWMILIGFVGFCVMQVFLKVARKTDVCCPDKWKLKGDVVEDVRGHKVRLSKPHLVDTAAGAFLKIKIASLIFEDVAGVALVLSHLAVWYFCEERHAEYGKQRLKQVHKD